MDGFEMRRIGISIHFLHRNRIGQCHTSAASAAYQSTISIVLKKSLPKVALVVKFTDTFEEVRSQAQGAAG
jgi:hypothetical protein